MISVISTDAAQQVQKSIIDAAIAAGVKRFVPSEFGVNTRKPGVEKTRVGEFLAGKRKVVDYLIQNEDKISWTGLSTGFFFDSVCCFPFPLIFSLSDSWHVVEHRK